jgi:predicted nucleic acid-binding protein
MAESKSSLAKVFAVRAQNRDFTPAELCQQHQSIEVVIAVIFDRVARFLEAFAGGNEQAVAVTGFCHGLSASEEDRNGFLGQPGDGHIEQFVNLMGSVNANHALVTDAHLAALAIEHQATICGHDSDFKLFSALSVFDPLQ